MDTQLDQEIAAESADSNAVADTSSVELLDEENPESESIPQDQEAAEKTSKPTDQIYASLPMTVNNREDLDRIIKDHHEWLESVLNPSKKIGRGRANLQGADLSGWDLTGINLSGATLKHAKLIGTKLYRANLTAADLSGADLQGADLREAKLKRALLYHADLREADMEGCDLSKAHTEFAKIKKTVVVEPEALAEEPKEADQLVLSQTEESSLVLSDDSDVASEYTQ